MFNSGKAISGQDTEFLIYFEEELQDTEKLVKGKPTEASFRVLAARARSLLHTSESVLERAYQVFNLQPKVPLIRDTFILYEQSTSSPAAYRVEFSKTLDLAAVKNFEKSTFRDDVYIVGTPLIGFDANKPKHLYTDPLAFRDYCQKSILSIDQTIISRWQLVSYLANKKGLAHYSETRDKAWQKNLDRFWNTKISNPDKSSNLRALNELLTRIHVEILNSTGLSNIRRITQALQSMQSKS